MLMGVLQGCLGQVLECAAEVACFEAVVGINVMVGDGRALPLGGGLPRWGNAVAPHRLPGWPETCAGRTRLRMCGMCTAGMYEFV